MKINIYIVILAISGQPMIQPLSKLFDNATRVRNVMVSWSKKQERATNGKVAFCSLIIWVTKSLLRYRTQNLCFIDPTSGAGLDRGTGPSYFGGFTYTDGSHSKTTCQPIVDPGPKFTLQRTLGENVRGQFTKG